MKLSMKRVFMWLGIGVMSLHEHYILCEYDCVCVRACGCVLKLMNITKITFCLFVCKIKRRAFHLSPSINTPIYLFDKMTRIGMQSATVIKTLHWNMKIHKSFIRGNLCGLFKGISLEGLKMKDEAGLSTHLILSDLDLSHLALISRRSIAQAAFSEGATFRKIKSSFHS